MVANKNTWRNLSNQNDYPELMKKQVIFHKLETYYISYKGIKFVFSYVRVKRFDLRDFFTTFSEVMLLSFVNNLSRISIKRQGEIIRSECLTRIYKKKKIHTT